MHEGEVVMIIRSERVAEYSSITDPTIRSEGKITLSTEPKGGMTKN